MEHDTARPGSAGEHLLQARCSTRERADKFYDEQVLHHLNESMRTFIGEQEMVFVATSDSYGECDCTLRAGPPGFVRVVNDRTLAYPEYRGNGVMASLGNIFENAQVGLLFVDFHKYRIGLHVNGRAEIAENDYVGSYYPELACTETDGPNPERWVVISVVEAYIHCSKNIPSLAKPMTENGANGVKRNGGDFFQTKAERRAMRVST